MGAVSETSDDEEAVGAFELVAAAAAAAVDDDADDADASVERNETDLRGELVDDAPVRLVDRITPELHGTKAINDFTKCTCY